MRHVEVGYFGAGGARAPIVHQQILVRVVDQKAQYVLLIVHEQKEQERPEDADRLAERDLQADADDAGLDGPEQGRASHDCLEYIVRHGNADADQAAFHHPDGNLVRGLRVRDIATRTTRGPPSVRARP